MSTARTLTIPFLVLILVSLAAATVFAAAGFGAPRTQDRVERWVVYLGLVQSVLAAVIAGLVLDAQGQPIPEIPVTFFRAVEPNKWWRQTQTYANAEVNSDDQLRENFALAYVPAGDYLVKVKIGEKSYVQPATVEPGDIAFVRIAAEH